MFYSIVSHYQRVVNVVKTTAHPSSAPFSHAHARHVYHDSSRDRLMMVDGIANGCTLVAIFVIESWNKHEIRLGYTMLYT